MAIVVMMEELKPGALPAGWYWVITSITVKPIPGTGRQARTAFSAHMRYDGAAWRGECEPVGLLLEREQAQAWARV